MRKLYSSFSLIMVLSLVLSLATWESSAGMGERAEGEMRPITREGQEEGPWVVRAYFEDREMVGELAAWKEPWEVNYAGGYVVIEVEGAEYEALERAGFRLEVDEKQTALLEQFIGAGQISSIPGFECYRTVEETYDTAEGIVAAYPELASWIDVGDSWEKGEPGGAPGYDLMVLRLTNGAVSGPKPKMFMMTSVHAREYTPAELGTRFAEYLVENYGVDADVTWLLDYHEIHLLLQANPDGRKKAETGLSWRKNTNENYCGPTSNNRGADLNRNFEFQWGCCGGSSGNECDLTYRGPSPASEPEVQAVQNYVRSQFPDQREDPLSSPAPITATGVFLDIHSYSELVLWPWGFTSSVAPNGTALQTLGRKLAYYNGYYPEQAIGLYPTDGTTDDFAYGDLGLAAYTYELGTSFFQDCATFEGVILQDNLPSLLYAAKAARTPYLTPAGPDALEVVVDPAGVAPGEQVVVEARIDDTRYNHSNGTEPTQNVVGAEYYIDVPPWVTSTLPIAYPMAAQDGSFDESVEEVEGTLDSSGLSAGRHTVYVRGQDAAGNWGVVSAAFLYVLDPAVSPTIQGFVRDANNNHPLDAMVSAGMFHASTNPVTGFYSMTVVSGTYDISALAAGYVVSTVIGVEAWDHQTVQQDFYLYPLCPILEDDVESGNQGWTAEGNWAITTEASHSSSHSWTDSPGGNYGNNWNYSLVSPVFDLSDYRGINLGFWHIHDLEDGYDYGYVEFSTNAGATWTVVDSFNGENQTTWMEEAIDLPALDGQPNARIRFRLDSDYYITGDGWHLDDLLLLGGGPACGPGPTPPTAEFTSNSPVALGNPLSFSNLTTGTLPIDYWWDFGDGVGTSIEINPDYSYATTGSFTVTLLATNTVGSDMVQHTVTVLEPPCVEVQAVDLVLITPGIIYTDTLVELSADISPDDATKPFSYTIDYGDGTPPLAGSSGTDPLSLYHIFAITGSHLLEVASWNCTMTEAVTDTLEVVVHGQTECKPLNEVSILGATAGAPGVYTFTTSIIPPDATAPVAYLWDNDDVVSSTVRFLDEGAHTLVVTATNCTDALVTDTHEIVISSTPVCTQVAGVDLTLVTSGAIYTDTLVQFSADIMPDDAVKPFSYTVHYGDGTPPEESNSSDDPLSLTHTFSITGTLTVEMAVWNCEMTVPVTDTVVVVVREPSQGADFWLYLPLISKDY